MISEGHHFCPQIYIEVIIIWTSAQDVGTYCIINMGESSKLTKSWTFEIQNSKQAICIQNNNNFKLNGQLSLNRSGVLLSSA